MQAEKQASGKYPALAQGAREPGSPGDSAHRVGQSPCLMPWSRQSPAWAPGSRNARVTLPGVSNHVRKGP